MKNTYRETRSPSMYAFRKSLWGACKLFCSAAVVFPNFRAWEVMIGPACKKIFIRVERSFSRYGNEGAKNLKKYHEIYEGKLGALPLKARQEFYLYFYWCDQHWRQHFF